MQPDRASTCGVCSTLIGYIDCPTGGWWAHEVHPADDHDAVPTCDRTKPSGQSPVPHDYEEIGEDYGSLGSGGSYWKLRCKVCGRIAYSPMPD